MSRVKTLMSTNSKSDPVISMVLDRICEQTGIDPTSILPDYKLSADLNMSVLAIQEMLFEAARDLGLGVTHEACRTGDTTPRQLCDLLKKWMANAPTREVA